MSGVPSFFKGAVVVVVVVLVLFLAGLAVVVVAFAVVSFLTVVFCAGFAGAVWAKENVANQHSDCKNKFFHLCKFYKCF